MIFFVPLFDVLIELAKEQLGFLMPKIIMHKAVKESSWIIYLSAVQKLNQVAFKY